MENPHNGSLSPHKHNIPDMNELFSPPRKYNCSICSSSFQRREHFERHFRSHSNIKDFKCDICDKRFSRRDTLQRHLTTHGQAPPTKVRKTLPRALRACLNCVISKQRCSGSHPCDRCSRRSWSCNFPKSSQGAPQGDETLLDATEQRMNSQHQTLGQNDVSEPSRTHGVPSIDTIHSDPSCPDGANFRGEPCAEIALPGQIRQTMQESDPASVFDSFLLWPLDDAFDHYDMASAGPFGLQTPSGMTGTVDQMINLPLGEEIPRHTTDGSGPFSSAHSENHAPENPLTEEDREILISDDYGHVPKPPISTYERICALYGEVSRFSPESTLPSLYSLDILHVCTQLYFEHFHRRFPILHQGTFEARSESWLLYLAVAAIGSQYSRFSNRTKIFCDLVQIIRVSFIRTLNSSLSLQNNLELAQAAVLFNLALLSSGERESIMHFQYQRNVLVTMCRPLLISGLLFATSSMLSNPSAPVGDWTRWIATESWKRVIYFTWLIECLQLVLFDLPPLITVGEMHLSIPCSDELWQCASFHDWERARGLQRDRGDCPSVVSLLKRDVFDQGHIISLSDSAIWISVFAVYVAERQASQQQSLHLYPSLRSTLNCRNISLGADSCSPVDEKDSVDAILGRFQQAATQYHQDSPVLSIATKFSLALRMLRFMPYRLLYVSSGWMAEHEEVDGATQHIAQLLHAEPRRARQSLLHAAQLFRIIRSQHQFDPFDSFILLMAILYIWNYDMFVISERSRHSSGGDAEEIFRIDQNMNKDLQDRWIADSFEMRKRLHIGGIGVLDGQSSVARILKESVRILHHEKAWSRQAKAIRCALQQILVGDAPSFPVSR